MRLRRPGVFLLVLLLVFAGLGVVADVPLLVLWSAAPTALLALERRRAVRLEASLLSATPPIGATVTTTAATVTMGTATDVILHLTCDPTLWARTITVAPVTTNDLAMAPPAQTLPIAPRASLAFRALPHHAGRADLHGVWLDVATPLGAFAVRHYLPVAQSLVVWPRADRPHDLSPLLGSAALPRGSRNAPPRPFAGLSYDLRELRDHRPGDPFKHIAWKATARARRLIVRDFEDERGLMLYALLDLGASLRAGPPGDTALDRATNLVFALARHAQESGAQMGLVTFAARVHGVVPSLGGPRLVATLTRALFDALAPTAADLQGLCDGELGVRLHLLAQAQHPGATPPPLPDDVPGACRAGGMAFTPRPASSAEARPQGIAAALTTVVRIAHGPHIVAVISDLGWPADSPVGREDDDAVAAVLSAVRHARARGHAVRFILPRPYSPPETLPARLPAALQTLAHHAHGVQTETRATALVRAGATVLTLGADGRRLVPLRTQRGSGSCERA